MPPPATLPPPSRYPALFGHVFDVLPWLAALTFALALLESCD